MGVPGSRPDSYSPNAATLSMGDGQALKGVHSLDYRYTHSLDANAKTSECASCHELNEFCSTCHNPDIEGDSGRLKPVWHGGSDWGAVTLVGSGGGRHAEMAKRDMETCAACHDIDVDDPTCMQCHVDRNIGLGNDPKTHEIGFMSDIQGEWHDDPTFLCFNCHVNTNTAGTGFCGYCHQG